MRYIITMLVLLCVSYASLAQDTTHTLEVGDTLADLEKRYDTCRAAIIYENDLALNGIYSKFYFLEAGAELKIPPKSACDSLPMEGYYTVAEGDTADRVLAKYRYPYVSVIKVVQSVTGEIAQLPIDMDTELSVGDELVIMPLMSMYSTSQELFVVDDETVFEPIEHTLQLDDNLHHLAETYDTCREAIIWENQLLVESSNSVGYVLQEGDTLTIPPATACDDLPLGQYELTVEDAMTQSRIITRYGQYAHAYFQINTPYSGLLPRDTKQILPDIENVFRQQFDLIVQPENFEPRVHTLQKGDTFSELTVRYKTCAEAMIYANPNLRRTNSINPTFIIKAGTEIEIPPASECDEIPDDPVNFIVKDGDTLWDIAYRYNLPMDDIIQASADSPESTITRELLPTMDFNKIGKELVFVIPDSSGEFDLRYGDRLLVYEEDDRIEYVSPNLSLSEVAKCYGIDRDRIEEENGLWGMGFNGGSLIIPDPEHDCILYGSNRYGTLACYPELIEDMVEISGEAPPVTLLQPDTAYCYDSHDVYEALFYDQPVILFDSDVNGYLDDNENWDLTWAMIDYCFRNDKALYRDVTWETYDATILPPDDNISVIHLPEHITCNREMFNDFYLYQVQSYDTLSGIAKAYGTHTDLIASANNMENKHMIFVGQYLDIPRPTLPQILQAVAIGIGLLLSVVGLRRLMRRQTGKAKRKPKE